MDREIGITSRHFDRREASGEIFENAFFTSHLKDFSATLEMTKRIKKIHISNNKTLKNFNFYY